LGEGTIGNKDGPVLGKKSGKKMADDEKGTSSGRKGKSGVTGTNKLGGRKKVIFEGKWVFYLKLLIRNWTK